MSEDEKLLPQELVITRLLNQRMVDEDCLRPGDRESVAYRIAELMIAAKELYTRSLPRLTEKQADSEPMFAELAGLRMAFLHLRDLVGDFEDSFMEAMVHQREEDEEAGEATDE